MNLDLPKSGLYMIRNIKSGKCYIGSAVNFERRLKAHRQMLRSGRHHSKHLQRAWNLDGEQNFSMFPISFIADVGRLIEFEQMAIDSHMAADKKYGYNMRRNAESNLGHKFSAEVRRKNADARRGKKLPDATRIAMSSAAKGIKKSLAHAKNIAAGKTGRPRPDVKDWAPAKFSRFDSGTVLRIREESKAGATVKQLSEKYGCSGATVSYAVRGIGAYYSSI